uniref:Uncharacterized protein n=1 Tax=viral metagenome TaxID=1070528 RepID=A0A6C0JV69_9ZZZZ
MRLLTSDEKEHLILLIEGFISFRLSHINLMIVLCMNDLYYKDYCYLSNENSKIIKIERKYDEKDKCWIIETNDKNQTKCRNQEEQLIFLSEYVLSDYTYCFENDDDKIFLVKDMFTIKSFNERPLISKIIMVIYDIQLTT